MTLRMTLDVSEKVKNKTHVTNWVRHVARDIDRENGVEARHSNPNIDGERTHLNVTRLVGSRDGQVTEWAPQSTGEFRSAIEQRLGTVTKPLRKDAVLMRPLVMQIGSAWYDENCPDWREGVLTPEAERLHATMLGWAVERFGVENIPGYSLHLDETTPQLQIAFVPVTDDGRLTQKAFFDGPASLRRMHVDLREHMRAAGFEVEMDSSERSREHLSTDGYARRAEDITTREHRAEEIERGLGERYVALREAEEAVTAREAAVDAREAEAAQSAATAALRAQQAAQALREAKERMAAADAAIARVEAREAEVRRREREVSEREHEVSDREAVVGQREDAVDQRETSVQVRERTVRDRERSVEAREERMDAWAQEYASRRVSEAFTSKEQAAVQGYFAGAMRRVREYEPKQVEAWKPVVATEAREFASAKFAFATDVRTTLSAERASQTRPKSAPDLDL